MCRLELHAANLIALNKEYEFSKANDNVTAESGTSIFPVAQSTQLHSVSKETDDCRQAYLECWDAFAGQIDLKTFDVSATELVCIHDVSELINQLLRK